MSEEAMREEVAQAVEVAANKAAEEEISKLQRYVQEIDKLCFKKGGEKFSYLQCTYRELLGDNADIEMISVSFM